jgi:hypothetical protein
LQMLISPQVFSAQNRAISKPMPTDSQPYGLLASCKQSLGLLHIFRDLLELCWGQWRKTCSGNNIGSVGASGTHTRKHRGVQQAETMCGRWNMVMVSPYH